MKTKLADCASIFTSEVMAKNKAIEIAKLNEYNKTFILTDSKSNIGKLTNIYKTNKLDDILF